MRKLDGLGVRGVGGAEGAGIRCTRNTPAVRSIAAGGARDGARDRVCALQGMSKGRAVSGAVEVECSLECSSLLGSSPRRAVASVGSSPRRAVASVGSSPRRAVASVAVAAAAAA